MAVPLPPAAVSLDLVGTLLFPHPSVGRVYARAAKALGHEVDPAGLEARFQVAMAQPAVSPTARDHWDEVVDRTFSGAVPRSALPSVQEACWQAFGRAESWRLARGALVTLAQLRFLGLRVGILSNADERLRAVMKANGLLGAVDATLLLAEEAQRKPGPAVFISMARALGCETGHLVHVGDSLEEDARAAQAAGATGVWLSAQPAPPGIRGLGRVTALPELMRDLLVPGLGRHRLTRRSRNLIANLRGHPEERGRSSEREAKSLDHAVEEAVRRLGLDQPIPEHAISAAWARLLPPLLARRTAPLRILANGKLMVQCEGATVRSEATFHSRALLAKIRALPGCGHVTGVGFTVA